MSCSFSPVTSSEAEVTPTCTTLGRPSSDNESCALEIAAFDLEMDVNIYNSNSSATAKFNNPITVIARGKSYASTNILPTHGPRTSLSKLE